MKMNKPKSNAFDFEILQHENLPFWEAVIYLARMLSN